MFRNQNGYWMTPGFRAMFAPDDGAGDGSNALADPAQNPGGDGGNDPAGNEPNAGGDAGNGLDAKELTAQLEQMKAELAKNKAALDKATKEAGDARKALKAKMTQEEIDAANKKEAEDRAAQELEELRREVSRAKSTKSVMSKLGVDEDTAGSIAECLTGCEDIENALLLIRKTWEAREKALKIEYGKVTAPGAGSSSEDKETQEAIRIAKELGQRRARSSESVLKNLGGIVR